MQPAYYLQIAHGPLMHLNYAYHRKPTRVSPPYRLWLPHISVTQVYRTSHCDSYRCCNIMFYQDSKQILVIRSSLAWRKPGFKFSQEQTLWVAYAPG